MTLEIHYLDRIQALKFRFVYWRRSKTQLYVTNG